MNVNDVKIEDIGVISKDMLQSIFDKQGKLMIKYHDIEKESGLLQTEDCPVNINDNKGQSRLKDFAWRITEELGEAMNCLKNKPWKQTHMITDETHYQEELIDALHFFVELLILSGMTAEDVYRMYCKKSEVNKFRQRSKY
jgi:hypothetical protein